MSEYTKTSRTTRTVWEPIDSGKEHHERMRTGQIRRILLTGALLMVGVGGLFGLTEGIVKPLWNIEDTSDKSAVIRSGYSDNNPSHTVTWVIDNEESPYCQDRIRRGKTGPCKEVFIWID